jgi:hypothetical protein
MKRRSSDIDTTATESQWRGVPDEVTLVIFETVVAHSESDHDQSDLVLTRSRITQVRYAVFVALIWIISKCLIIDIAIQTVICFNYTTCPRIRNCTGYKNESNCTYISHEASPYLAVKSS